MKGFRRHMGRFWDEMHSHELTVIKVWVSKYFVGQNVPHEVTSKPTGFIVNKHTRLDYKVSCQAKMVCTFCFLKTQNNPIQSVCAQLNISASACSTFKYDLLPSEVLHQHQQQLLKTQDWFSSVWCHTNWHYGTGWHPEEVTSVCVGAVRQLEKWTAWRPGIHAHLLEKTWKV